MLDEAFFTLIRSLAWRDLGIRRIEKLRKYIRREGYRAFQSEINRLMSLVREMEICVLEDRATFEEIVDTATRFSVLPADAIIALTCKHYGIQKILTFDEDFKRIPWLTVTHQGSAD